MPNQEKANARKSKRKQPEKTQYIQAWVKDEKRWCRAITKSSLDNEILIVDFVDWSAGDGWDCKRIPKAHVSGINSVQFAKMGKGKVYKVKQFQTGVGGSSSSSSSSSVPTVSERPCKRIKMENDEGEYDGEEGEYKEQTTTPEADADEEVGINEMKDVKMAVKVKQDTKPPVSPSSSSSSSHKSSSSSSGNNEWDDTMAKHRATVTAPTSSFMPATWHHGSTGVSTTVDKVPYKTAHATALKIKQCTGFTYNHKTTSTYYYNFPIKQTALERGKSRSGNNHQWRSLTMLEGHTVVQNVQSKQRK